MVGIYKITNQVNGHSYIGQSVDISRRWRNEKTHAFLPESREYNSTLSCAFRKYGIDNFQFTVLEECGIHELDSREQYWIKYYDTYNNGYNQTMGGRINPILTEPTYVSQIRQELINTSTSMPELAHRYNVSVGTIGGINLGTTWHSDKYNYPLRNVHLKEHLAPRQYAVNLSREELVSLITQYKGNLSAVATQLGVTRGALRRPIEVYQLKDFIQSCRQKKAKIAVDERVIDDLGNVFASPAEANHYYSCAHVKEVCDGKRKTCGGHTFRWYRDIEKPC